jgi:hypothetical protein
LSSGPTFSNGFDDQSTGGVATGTGANQFSGTSGFTSLRVENTAVSGPPNALAVALNGGGSAYVYKKYGSAYTHYDLTFNLQLSTDFALGSNSDWVNVAQTVPSTSSNVGKVTVVLPADNRIRLDYFDSAAQQHSLWGSYAVPTGNWHKVELRETMGAGSGSLALLVDGTTVASGSNLDLSPQGLTWFAVGERYAPPDSGTAGHLYIDDVAAGDLAASAPATTPASSTATVIPVTSTTPAAANILPLTATQTAAAVTTPVSPSNTSVPAPTATSVPAPASTSPTMTTSISTTTTRANAIKTVFLIVLENHNWSSIQGNTSEAPYINSLLSGANNSQTSYATQYFNPPGNHPSLPNYLWLEAGTNFGIADDNLPSGHPLNTASHLVALLNNAGISWKAYQEGISDGTCPLSDNYPYAPKHNAFVYFNDVNGSSSYCAAHERSYSNLAGDLANNTVARYNFITPNLCDDMHDSCSPTHDAIKQGDSWLQSNLPTILGSQAYKNGGAVFITWDEGEGSDGPLGLIVLAPAARGHGYHNAIRYTHSSTLRTLEEIYGVRPLVGDAQNATDLSDLFATFP